MLASTIEVTAAPTATWQMMIALLGAAGATGEDAGVPVIT
jgi:hypothetical protein